MDNQVEGLDDYLKKLDMVQKKAPARIMDELDKEAKTIVRSYRKMIKVNAQENPKKKRNHLRNGMKYTETEKKQGEYEKGVFNDSKKAPHYHLVEHGHKLVKGKRGRKGEPSQQRVIGQVKGKKYFFKTFTTLIPKIEKDREKLLNKAFKELS